MFWNATPERERRCGKEKHGEEDFSTALIEPKQSLMKKECPCLVPIVAGIGIMRGVGSSDESGTGT